MLIPKNPHYIWKIGENCNLTNLFTTYKTEYRWFFWTTNEHISSNVYHFTVPWISLLHFGRICSNFFMLAYIAFRSSFSYKVFSKVRFGFLILCTIVFPVAKKTQHSTIVTLYRTQDESFDSHVFVLSCHGDRTSICTIPSKLMIKDRCSSLESI